MLSIDDVLSVRHPESPRLSRDGTQVAFLYNVDGRRELWCAGCDGGTPTRTSRDGQLVRDFHWGSRLAYLAGGEVWIAGEPQPLLAGAESVSELRWSPDGRRLAVLRQGRILIFGDRLREIVTPGSALGALRWSPDGTRIACSILENGHRDLAVVDAGSGAVLWRTTTPEFEYGVGWVGNGRLSYGRAALDAIRREFVITDFRSEEITLRQEDLRGFRLWVPPVATADAVAYTVPVDGWMHVLIHDVETGRQVLPLPGQHEDLGTETEEPSFSADGRYLAFASNRGDLRQRHIWRHDRRTGATLQMTLEPGTQVHPCLSRDGSRVAHIACGPFHSAEVAVSGRALTRSLPPAWTEAAIVAPEHVMLSSSDGMAIHADLFVPHGLDRGQRHPAIVFLHGGSIRQMRYGWHPRRAYAIFHTFNQYLLDRGYVVLSVDYRGSTGYGADYEGATHLQAEHSDVEDCVAGAEYLAGLPYVDGARIGVWGVSYGGYLTLACLSRHPRTFAMGIEICGIWDRALQGRGAGLPDSFTTRLGGRDTRAAHFASPKNFAEGLMAPLLCLHGAADTQVAVAQLDAVVADCTALGKDFAALRYPGESHVFTQRTTWADAFGRMADAFDRYLRCDPAARPRAMI